VHKKEGLKGDFEEMAQTHDHYFVSTLYILLKAFLFNVTAASQQQALMPLHD
jgi:hypothetical protein